MQFRDLGAQYNALKKEIDSAIAEVVAGGKFISGPEVKQLEVELADYVGVKHCISCANGTDALELVLRAWGVGAGDAVFVPTFTFMSTAEVVSYLGATPIFVDIDPRTFNMSVDSLEFKIKKVLEKGELKPVAVIPVDLFGQPAEYDKISIVASRYELKILEDGAQGFGGEIRGKKACSFGDAATTSFFPAKPLGCYGDGGAVFTDNDDLDRLLRSLCVHGKGLEKYENVRIGRNSRLDTIQAAILLPKFYALRDYEVKDINCIASRYADKLSSSNFVLPLIKEGYRSSWAQYSLLLPDGVDRFDLQSFLKSQGVPTMVYYPRCLHLQEAFSYCGGKEGDLPIAESISKRILALPIHPYMTEDDQDKVVESLLRAGI